MGGVSVDVVHSDHHGLAQITGQPVEPLRI
jgi:hypothetical protein